MFTFILLSHLFHAHSRLFHFPQFTTTNTFVFLLPCFFHNPMNLIRILYICMNVGSFTE